LHLLRSFCLYFYGSCLADKLGGSDGKTAVESLHLLRMDESLKNFDLLSEDLTESEFDQGDRCRAGLMEIVSTPLGDT
jgi:hypothetical protein